MDKEREIHYLEICDAIDGIERFQALVTVRHYLAGHSHEQIASDLGLSEQESIRIASGGLRRIKNQVLNT